MMFEALKKRIHKFFNPTDRYPEISAALDIFADDIKMDYILNPQEQNKFIKLMDEHLLTSTGKYPTFIDLKEFDKE